MVNGNYFVPINCYLQPKFGPFDRLLVTRIFQVMLHPTLFRVATKLMIVWMKFLWLFFSYSVPGVHFLVPRFVPGDHFVIPKFLTFNIVKVFPRWHNSLNNQYFKFCIKSIIVHVNHYTNIWSPRGFLCFLHIKCWSNSSCIKSSDKRITEIRWYICH